MKRRVQVRTGRDLAIPVPCRCSDEFWTSHGRHYLVLGSRLSTATRSRAIAEPSRRERDCRAITTTLVGLSCVQHDCRYHDFILSHRAFDTKANIVAAGVLFLSTEQVEGGRGQAIGISPGRHTHTRQLVVRSTMVRVAGRTDFACDHWHARQMSPCHPATATRLACQELTTDPAERPTHHARQSSHGLSARLRSSTYRQRMSKGNPVIGQPSRRTGIWSRW